MDQIATVRVLLIARGGALDGAERQLAYLAEGLDRSRYEPVVALDREGPLADHLRAHKIETHVMAMRPWRSIGGFFRRRADAHALTELARSRGIRMVHASDLWKTAYALFIADQLRIPSVVHVRGPMAQRDMTKHRLRDASAVVPIAKRYCSALLEAGITKEQIVQIDDAVDLERFHPENPHPWGVRERFRVGTRLAVGLVGRIEPFKKTLEFIDIVAKLPRSGTVAFLLIGHADNPPYLAAVNAAIRRHGLGDRVILTGRCDDMPAIIGSLDLLVTLSGGSIMFEAMACAKPVLSIRADALHSVHVRHEETGLCVKTADSAVAASYLQRLIDNAGLRERLGTAARAWAEKHLSAPLLVDRTQALYDRLLGKAAIERPLSALSS